MMRVLRSTCVLALLGLLVVSSASVGARQSKPAFDYRIGARDVLTVNLFGQDPRYSGDVTVRPDGKISLLFVDEIQAAGRTPLQLKDDLTKAYAKYFEQPVVWVSPKQINSLKVFILGEVFNSGAYDFPGSMNIVQLITLAGGMKDYADKENIVLIRREPLPDGKPDRVWFNYKKLLERGSGEEIPELQPGDQVLVK